MHIVQISFLHNFRLVPQNRWDLCCSWTLHSI